ncbi:sulfate transporter family-domain-containing protein [Cladochytrium replicatum]|nr:sulfate transporter family-domain-containing protein [Cladochytrium replicatum]
MGSKSAELEHIEKGHDPHSNDHTSNPLNQQDRDANIGKEDWRATALAWLRMVQENVALLVGDADQNMNATWKSFLRPWLFYLFPIAEQLHPKRYSWGFLLADILAALSVTAMIIPQSLAYGSLAGVPPMQCFVSASFPLLVYAFLGSGRQLALGPEALTSVLVGVYASKEVASNGGTVGDIAGALAVMVAIGCFILAVLQAGFVDNILAGFLLTGFVCGIATLVMVEQLPGLLGIVIHHDPNASAAEFFWEVILNMGDTHLNTAMIALTNVTFLMVAKKLKKKYGPKLKTSPWGKYLLLIPELFILVVIMISIGFSRDLGGKGVKMLGEIKVQLQFKPIQLSSEVFMRLIQPAVIITVMAFVVSQVVNRTFGMENNYTVSKHRELVALGAANLVSAAAGGYVVCGSLPRSRILATAGGRSMLCNLLVGIFTLCGVMSLASTFAYLPKATLSAAVFVAAYGLIDWTEIGFLFRLRSYWEIAQFLVTYVITIGSSISYGVIFCLMLAALVIVRRTTRLEMGIMGRLTLYTISDKDRTEARDKQLLGKSPFGDEQATSSNIRESNSVSSSDTTRASLIPPGVQFRTSPILQCQPGAS